MIHDCVVIHPLAEIPIDSEGDFVESDMVMDYSDEDDGLEETIKGLNLPS